MDIEYSKNKNYLKVLSILLIYIFYSSNFQMKEKAWARKKLFKIKKIEIYKHTLLANIYTKYEQF